jgi:hypothetical protein
MLKVKKSREYHEIDDDVGNGNLRAEGKKIFNGTRTRCS